jgi:Tfp pilus assembly protein PilO
MSASPRACDSPEPRKPGGPTHGDFVRTWIGVVAIAVVQVGTMLYASGAQREKLGVVGTQVEEMKRSQEQFQLEATRTLENLGTRLGALEKRFERLEDRR